MIRETELVLPPGTERDHDAMHAAACRVLNIAKEELTALQVMKRSLDARSREPVYRLRVRVFINEAAAIDTIPVTYRHTEASQPVHIIGFGPAGMFAALRLLELGYKPIVYERGKNVRDRRRDLRAIQITDTVNPESNYCFGEGGAGTYSDGKLYTRSTKRGDVNRILQILCNHGAVQDIMVDAHPHIGSNKLPQIVQRIRETIIAHGGEVHFGAKVTDIVITDGTISALTINDALEVPARVVILATGHSARDIFSMLEKKQVHIEPKPFAVGVRIEHPQALINRSLYHGSKSIPILPPAAYNLTCQYKSDGVFSFCMCPGGIIVPAATAPGEIVLNGMSVSRRDSPYANSGFVVTVNESDFAPFANYGNLQGMYYQAAIEKAAFTMAAGKQAAPSQRVTDFLQNKISASLPGTSYKPGVFSADLSKLFDTKIISGLKHALKEFDKKLPGYVSEEAVLAAPETRTSSPVKINREKDSAMHVQVKGLFPCGEGAGYAGGIVSAAIDGENSAASAARFLSV